MVEALVEVGGREDEGLEVAGEILAGDGFVAEEPFERTAGRVDGGLRGAERIASRSVPPLGASSETQPKRPTFHEVVLEVAL